MGVGSSGAEVDSRAKRKMGEEDAIVWVVDWGVSLGGDATRPTYRNAAFRLLFNGSRSKCGCLVSESFEGGELASLEVHVCPLCLEAAGRLLHAQAASLASQLDLLGGLDTASLQ
ncbi:hypothetical protein WUBG_17079 [Wuchereria bancrofti]|uniref:Uncharacterized protein n=1 Tax=Wuchereria bancrofti TaxID=6293 RepID=J9DQV7_WUCBA|nr:hypothetical protein WUBG_17079 [Wuchereria bancrofti]